MSTIGERIKFLRSRMNLTQQELSDKTGINRGNLSNYEKGKMNPASDTIIALSSFFGVSTDWLLTGKESMQSNGSYSSLDGLSKDDKTIVLTFIEFLKSRSRNESFYRPKRQYWATSTVPESKEKCFSSIYLPVFNNTASNPIEILELGEGEIQVNSKHSKYNSFIIRARDSSMIGDGIEHDDLIAVRPQPIVENGEIALVNVDGQVTIRHFYRSGDSKCELRSSNPDYRPMFYSLKGISILGKVVEIIGKNIFF